jgi:hypothetical protein
MTLSFKLYRVSVPRSLEYSNRNHWFKPVGVRCKTLSRSYRSILSSRSPNLLLLNISHKNPRPYRFSTASTFSHAMPLKNTFSPSLGKSYSRSVLSFLISHLRVLTVLHFHHRPHVVILFSDSTEAESSYICSTSTFNFSKGPIDQELPSMPDCNSSKLHLISIGGLGSSIQI